MPEITTTTRAIVEYGVLVVIAAIFLGIIVYYLLKIWPEDKKYQRDLNGAILEQVALSRQALETSNLVISQNSGEMKDNRASHVRVGERLGCLEDKVERHDQRSEEMQVTLGKIATKLDV